MQNKKHSLETIEKIRLSTKGIKKTTEHKKKISQANKGEKNPKWKGGITKSKAKAAIRRRMIRSATIEALGGVCERCNFSDSRALQIDHINGGGSRERKERLFGCEFHKFVLKSFLNGENKYQLLCANCNWIKRCENNEARGRSLKNCAD